jgi:ATP-dependent RNA helicase RhlE
MRPGRPRCLVLTPTRELAAQVEESVRTYGKFVAVKSMAMYGGVSMQPQLAQLRKRVDILVATPGRLLDHAQQRTVDLSQVQILVLDEADRMLDMGFIADIRRVIKLLPPRRQNLLFSATYSDDIRRLAQNLLRQPVEIEVARRNAPVDSVEQRAYMVPKDQKRALLSHLIHDGDWSQVLVFTRTKHGANRLTKQLQDDGIQAAAIHGNKSQAARTQALAGFKNYDVRALVATEVASRGLDIKELPHVVNYELPNVPEDYVHRIGRTGRAGATGIAVSLVAHDEAGLLRDIEKVLRKQIPQLPLPHFARSQPQPERAPAVAARHPQPRQQNSQPRQQQSLPRQQHSQSKPQHAHAKKKNRRRWNPSRGQQSGAAHGGSGRG